MSESGDDGPGQREVAYRLFATEYEDADLEHSESDEERAPNYVITPTGGRVNRLFVVGVLTEVEPVSDDVLRGRVVDPTGAFVCYAGQYQPDERAYLDRAEPPTFVAVTGKARTFQPEDSDRVFTSVRPESISDVDAGARDRWTVDAAEQTLHRVEAMATGLALDATGEPLRAALVDRGYDDGLAAGVDLAIQHYGTTPTYLAAVRDLAIDAARHVAGDLEEVPALEVDPADDGDVTAADLLADPVEPLDATGPSSGPDSEPAAEESAEVDTEPDESAETTAEPEEPGEPSTEPEEPVEPEPSVDEASDDSAATEPLEDEPETPAAAEGEGPGDFEPGEFDLDDDEREEIEDEYGTEFQSGTEVDEPGEAGIETPAPEDVDAEPEEVEPESSEEPSADEADESVEGAPADVDLVDAVVSAMGDLDDGDGADHAAVVETVAESHGAEADAIEDAIEEALMEGRCYEPDDATLKPI